MAFAFCFEVPDMNTLIAAAVVGGLSFSACFGFVLGALFASKPSRSWRVLSQDGERRRLAISHGEQGYRLVSRN